MRALPLAAACAAAACGAGGRGGVAAGTQAELAKVQFGRLVDVYGLRITSEGAAVDLYRRDVVIGGNIQDQRAATSLLRDDEISYDFIGTDPDTLQPKLLIPRDMTSSAFATLFDQLDDELREVTPMLFGEGGPGFPYSVVPRNGAIRLVFAGSLAVDDAFFVERNAQGQVTGLRNTEAVQLLKIVGDPTRPNGFVPMPVRIVVQGDTLVLDPVLLGGEGLQYQTTNNASGLPASPDSYGSNIRIALALDGPLAMPRLHEGRNDITGLDNAGRSAIVRDFRSGNANDDSSDIARGFVRDPLPLRVVGEIRMYLERVDELSAFTQEVTVFKNGVSHEIDRGDVLRFVRDASGIPFGSGEVVVDPEDDLDNPTQQHVRVRIRRIDGLESLDPSNLPGYPSALPEREPWLVANAPRAICVAEFTAGGALGRDDPRNFLAFSPAPLPLNGVQPALNEFVSPHAEAIVRFSKPVDVTTVRWADTFFFAMRDLTTAASIEEFINNVPNAAGGIGMNPASFDAAKYRTPYLITARVIDEDGSQTSLRLRPTSGFYLDATMRTPPPGADYRYFLHLISESTDGGIRDLAGNRLDLQGTTADRNNSVVIPFTVDTRSNGSVPVFQDNLAVSIVSRFASRDEDANPSLFIPAEVQPPGVGSLAAAYPLEDLFGDFVYLDNQLVARQTTRTKVVADNLNQTPFEQQPLPPAPPNPLGACPQSVNSELQIATNTANSVVNAGIQNPLNPYGCRLQTLWREIDLSLSRTNPSDFNLDIEQMYWAPFTGTSLLFDEFDQIGLWLSLSEYRPIPCVGAASALTSTGASGLQAVFDKNIAWNPSPIGGGATAQSQAPRRAVFFVETPNTPPVASGGVPMTINPANVVFEGNGINRFLPLPRFEKPYFVYRDETVVEQGGNSGVGSDLAAGSAHPPYVLSPFMMGLGRHWVDVNGVPGSGVVFASSYWNDGPSQGLTNGPDPYTGGLVGNIALPLLADFWTYCDESSLPAGGGYIALGTNGWQVAVTVQSGPTPNFRVLSAGRPAGIGTLPPQCRGPGDSSWNLAAGGFAGPGSTIPPPGQPTPNGDNTFYWIMLDVLKRQSVITNGFVDINNPHRVPEGFADPRLGPYYLSNGASTLPATVRPSFAYEFDPPLSQLPPGTSLVPQFRGASIVDPNPWYWSSWVNGAGTAIYPAATFNPAMREQMKPTAANFPLDPYKAGDAHLRKWDTRGSPPRNNWTYLYNRTVTRYVENPNQLVDPQFTEQYSVAGDPFTPQHVRYLNWRFVASNNTDTNPAVSPAIETFALSYRFE